MTRTEKQQEAVKKWIANGCRGTFAWATGTGKTRAAIIAIKSFLSKNKGKNILVVVPTDQLKIQWALELDKFGIIQEVNVEIINSAIKYSENIDLLVLDEVHRYASESFSTIFNVKRPKLILGLSATFTRLDGKHKFLEKFCPVIDRITVKEALDNNWLSDYREYKVLIEADDFHYYREMSSKFQEMFSFFNFDFDTAMNCVKDIRYRRLYAKNLGIDHKDMDGITFTWIRCLKERKSYILNHPKKIEITKKILEARPYTKAITFSGSIKQAEKIGIGYVVHSKKTKKKNRLTIEEFNEMPTGILNTSQALDEGADLNGLNLAIVLSNTSSKRQKIQRIGRVIRKEEGKISEVFTLVMKNTVEERWFENSSQDSSYLEISEEELEDVLSGQEVNRIEREGKEVDRVFRI